MPSVVLSSFFLIIPTQAFTHNLFSEFANYFFTFSNESSNKIIGNLSSLYAFSHIITTKTTVSRITAETVGSVLLSAKEKKMSTAKETTSKTTLDKLLNPIYVNTCVFISESLYHLTIQETRQFA